MKLYEKIKKSDLEEMTELITFIVENYEDLLCHYCKKYKECDEAGKCLAYGEQTTKETIKTILNNLFIQ